MALSMQATTAPAMTVADNTPPSTSNYKIYNTVFQSYPDILNVNQVSEILNVSTKTVYRLLNEGALDSLKVGRAYKIPKLYVLQYVKVLNPTQ